jgi:hypothetical protein
MEWHIIWLLPGISFLEYFDFVQKQIKFNLQKLPEQLILRLSISTVTETELNLTRFYEKLHLLSFRTVEFCSRP